MKKIFIHNVFSFSRLVIAMGIFLSMQAFAGDDSARQECIKDCQSAKESHLRSCEGKSGDALSECRDRAQDDALSCSNRCDSKYPVQ